MRRRGPTGAEALKVLSGVAVTWDWGRPASPCVGKAVLVLKAIETAARAMNFVVWGPYSWSRPLEGPDLLCGGCMDTRHASFGRLLQVFVPLAFYSDTKRGQMCLEATFAVRMIRWVVGIQRLVSDWFTPTAVRSAADVYGA